MGRRVIASLPDPGRQEWECPFESPMGHRRATAPAAAPSPRGHGLTAQHPWLPGRLQEPLGALRADTAKPHARNNPAPEPRRWRAASLGGTRPRGTRPQRTAEGLASSSHLSGPLLE